MNSVQDISTSHDPHGDHLAHHFGTHRQQADAAKLGMWLFLATEILLFGGLFCAYAVYRGNRPELFDYGSQFLDTSWGAINTIVLIFSSFTMAIAVWCAQHARKGLTAFFLVLTLLCGIDFLGIKYIEYMHKFHENLVWGVGFYEPAHPPPAALEDALTGSDLSPAAATLLPGDEANGRILYRNTCAACHGARGEGLPSLGKPLQTSDFVAGLDDRGVVEFLKVGRMPNDPLNTTGQAMLPRGGNSRLSDQDLYDITAFLRVLMSRPDGEQPAGAPANRDQASARNEEGDAQEAFSIPRSIVPVAEIGPLGFSQDALGHAYGRKPAMDSHTAKETKIDPRYDPNRPPDAHLFFGIYFAMTGLHGVHVVIGLIVITWLLIRTLRGHFSHSYFTPVDLGGLYWHIVDVIWIFLFPLLYLIH